MVGYTCHFCDFKGDLLGVVKHQSSVHKSTYGCFICGEYIPSHNVRKHIRHAHPSACTVHCFDCKKPFVAEADLCNHLRSCAKSMKRKSRRKNRGPRVWPCDLCSTRLRSKTGVQTHKKAVHGIIASAAAVPTGFNTFLDRCRPGDVHKYISQHLQTDESFRDECSDVVDRVASFFKRSSLFTVTRFIKGGSLAKGTAIRSKSDIDCVMFISELPPIDSDDYYGQLQRHLEQMERALIRSKNSIAYNFEVVGRTSYAVQLRVKTQKRDHESHDVDLLLATDLLGPVLSSIKKEEVYAMMGRMDARSRENCSAALVELQRDFVKKQPAEVKDLIRLVKMWKSSCVTETSLTSYPLELLCIHTWPSYGTVSAAFQAVLQKLRDYSSICAYWTDNYSFHRVQTMLGKRPLILDPANPYNNVADRCRDWDAVARAAKKTLQKPFFSRY